VEQIGSKAEEEGRGDPVKTIQHLGVFWCSLGFNMKDHRRKLPGPSQMTQNSDGL
jgi:hypothetical protein